MQIVPSRKIVQVSSGTIPSVFIGAVGEVVRFSNTNGDSINDALIYKDPFASLKLKTSGKPVRIKLCYDIGAFNAANGDGTSQGSIRIKRGGAGTNVIDRAFRTHAWAGIPTSGPSYGTVNQGMMELIDYTPDVSAGYVEYYIQWGVTFYERAGVGAQYLTQFSVYEFSIEEVM